MNDFGMILAWSAVRVTLVMIPVIVVYLLASRRSPLSGAWGAGMGLSVVVLVTLWSVFPTASKEKGPALEAERIKFWPDQTDENRSKQIRSSSTPHSIEANSLTSSSIHMGTLIEIWSRIEWQSITSVERLHSWGRIVAWISLFGMGIGAANLALGLLAVSLCRRRGTIVDDEELLALLDRYRLAIGISRGIEIREVADLATPATAGWLRPLIMVPEDWRCWDESEKRAVLAHELAHIKRGDYGIGLMARLAVILNFYHPVVRWLSAQLQLQQELAADAIGAEFAGGRGAYLRALSSLALRQEGRVTQGPARAFLPARGTLIRRIAMLRVDDAVMGRPWTLRLKVVATLMLMAAVIGVGLMRGPALAQEPESKLIHNQPSQPHGLEKQLESFDLSFVTNNAGGFFAIRPAALSKKPGMEKFAALINREAHKMLIPFAKSVGITLADAEKGPLRIEMIEQASCSAEVFTRDVKVGPKHRFVLHTLMARTLEPFDWVKLVRDWKFDLTEVSVGDRKYYRLEGKLAKFLGPNGGFFCPDERTIVWDDEKHLVELLSRDKSFLSPYLKATGWEEVSRGLLAVAFDNRKDNWTKDLIEIGDEYKMSVKNVDFWIGGLADGESTAVSGFATCRDMLSSQDVAKSFDQLVTLIRKVAAEGTPESKSQFPSEFAFNAYKNLFDNMRVSHEGKTVTIRSALAEKLSNLGDLLSQSF